MADSSAHDRLQVGAPDPELNTSPIVGDEMEAVEVESRAQPGCCYFNSVEYPLGGHVVSGSELLRCEAPGVWVRAGELPPGAH
jgi:hypothetical protein